MTDNVGLKAGRRRGVFALLSLGVLGAALAVSAPFLERSRVEAQEAPATIDDPVVLRVCATCHTLERVVSARKTDEEWQTALERMRRYGAPIDEHEANRIASYLAGLLPRGDGKPSALTDDLVKARCAQCHGLELVEANRKTPEGWNFTVNHMRWLSQKANMAPVQTGVQAISKEEGERIAAYLSQKLPVLKGEREQLESLDDPKELRLVCGGCHGLETLKTQLKTAEAWDQTLARMHHFRQGWGYMWSNGYSPVKLGGLTEEAAMKVVTEWLKKHYSSDTEEWKQHAKKSDLSLTGAWAINGTDAKGDFLGTMVFTPAVDSANNYTVSRTVYYVNDDKTKTTWEGTAALYAGSSLRTHYTWKDPKSIGFLGAMAEEKKLLPPGVPIVVNGSFERKFPTIHLAGKGETLGAIAEKYGCSVEALRDVNTLKGAEPAHGQALNIPDRDAFSGKYHFDGIPGQGGKETYTRERTDRKKGAPPVVIAVIPNVLRRGASTTVLVVGTDLVPYSLASFGFGEGIKVNQVRAIESAGGTKSPRVSITVNPETPLGARDFKFTTTSVPSQSATLPDAVNVIGGIDYIQVEHNGPEYGPIFRTETTTVPVARLGGAPIFAEGPGREFAKVLPKVPVQLRGAGFSNGPDGKKGTDDDVRIGEVAVVWSAAAVDVTKTRELKGGDPAGGEIDLVESNSKAVDLPGGLGTFRYVVNPEKNATWGSLSKDGLFMPGSEEPRVELAAGAAGKPVPHTSQTNTSDNRGTVLVEATYSGDLASPGAGELKGHMIVVLGPPKWTTWTPYNDATAGVYNSQRRPGSEGPSEKLSDSGLFADTAKQTPAPERIPYNVTTQLWSDYALKDRTISVPELAGKRDTLTVGTAVDGWQFPAGTSIVKNFYLERTRGDASTKRIIETRVLMKRGGAWQGFSYEWNDAGTDATLLSGGKQKAFDVVVDGKATTQVWDYPSRSDCFRCHTTAAGTILGLQTIQQTAAQIQTFDAKRIFSSAPKPSANPLASLDGSASVEARARSYLHVNCSMCHRPAGGAPTSFDLRWETSLENSGVLLAEPKFGDMGTKGARILTPGDPDRSLLYLRMTATGSNRMPPLATSHVDPTAAKVLREWISSLK